MKLTGRQSKQLLDALISAFPTTSTLEQMVATELDQNLNAIAAGGSLIDITFNLIHWADSQGRMADLVRGAAHYNPGNRDLQVFVRDIWDAQASSVTPACNTSGGGSSASHTQLSLTEIKRQALQERRIALVQDFNAVNGQINQALSNLDRQRLGRQLEALERDITQVDSDLSKLL